MQGRALGAAIDLTTKEIGVSIGLVRLGDGGQVQHLPVDSAQALHEAHKVVFVQALHDDHSAALGAVGTGHEGPAVGLVGGVAQRRREHLIGLLRVVDDQQVGPDAGCHAVHRRRPADAAARGLHGVDGLTARGQAGLEDALIEGAVHHLAGVFGEGLRQLLTVAHRHHLGGRIVAEEEGRQRRRDADRLQVARRQGDDEPADLALGHRVKPRTDEVQVGIPDQLDPR